MTDVQAPGTGHRPPATAGAVPGRWQALAVTLMAAFLGHADQVVDLAKESIRDIEQLPGVPAPRERS
jgi:hypothetical protein